MRFLLSIVLVFVCSGVLGARQRAGVETKVIPSAEIPGSISIVAWDSLTGDLGVAVQSNYLGVGALVPFAKAGAGALATQGQANPGNGPAGIEMLERGLSARQVVDSLVQSDPADPGSRDRQVGIVDAKGSAVAYTGSGCQPYAGHITGRGYSVQGSMLAGEVVLKALARTFEITPGDLAGRLLSALEAGQRAGGDKSGHQSAALLVVREKGGYGGFNDRFVDIRVDDDSLALIELRRIYSQWTAAYLPDARMRSIDEFTRMRNFAAAEEELKRMIALLNEEIRNRPGDPEVLNRVAWVLATHDIDRERALELAKRAAALATGKTSILNTLAECHYRLGHYDESIAIESELVTREPANDTYWKQLQKFKEAKQKGGR